MTRRRFEEWEYAMIQAQYPHMHTAIIAAMLERSATATYQAAYRLGLRKADTYLASPAARRLGGVAGLACRFPKGHQPWNKGTRFVAGGRSVETRFKPGTRQGVAVKLWKPVGTERVSKDGYLERKVNDDLPLQRRWRAVHLIVWEAANGPLPKGHAITFRNKDKSDIRLENLELVTRKELLARNWHRRYPKALRQLVQLRGALTRQINKRNRNG
jgi:hypothetical protein